MKLCLTTKLFKEWEKVLIEKQFTNTFYLWCKIKLNLTSAEKFKPIKIYLCSLIILLKHGFLIL